MRIYKLNSFDKFSIPVYRRFRTWLLVTFFLTITTYLLKLYTTIQNINYIHNITLSLLGFMVVIAIVKQIKDIRKIGYIHKYLTGKRLEKNIKNNLIDTMLVNKAIGTKRIKIPDVSVDFRKYYQGVIKVNLERLGGMDDIEKTSITVSNAFSFGKYKGFATTISKEHEDKTEYTFYLEDVSRDLRLKPRTFVELSKDLDLYTYRLQKGVNWSLSHGLVAGRTGSGKSTFLYGLLGQMLEKELHDNIFIVDPKNEFNVFSNLVNVAKKPNDVLNMVKKVLDIMEEREEEVSKLVEKNEQFGATAKDFNIKPIILIVDEASSISEAFETKKDKDLYKNYLMQIVQRGRSSSIFQIQSLQVASTEFLPSSIRNQLSLRVQLGTPTTVDLQFLFGTDYHNLSRSVDKFTGYYYLDGMESPQKLFITDVHKYGLNNITKIRRK